MLADGIPQRLCTAPFGFLQRGRVSFTDFFLLLVFCLACSVLNCSNRCSARPHASSPIIHMWLVFLGAVFVVAQPPDQTFVSNGVFVESGRRLPDGWTAKSSNTLKLGQCVAHLPSSKLVFFVFFLLFFFPKEVPESPDLLFTATATTETAAHARSIRGWENNRS